MTDATEDNEDDKKTGKSGGKSGSASGGGVRLPPSKLAEVTKAFKYLDATAVVAAAAEFFSELPARASAHVQVSYEAAKHAAANLKNDGYAVVTQFLKYGTEVYRLMHNLTRENVEILRNRYGLNVSNPG